MTDTPTAGIFTGPGTTNGQAKQAQNDILAVQREQPGGSAETELTIADGSITPTTGIHTVDTQADAAADDLANIVTTNHPDGRLLLLRPENAARVVTLKHQAGGAGQIALAGGADVVLSDPSECILLKRTGTDWEQVTLASGALLPNGDGSGLSGVLTQGTHTIFIPAAAMRPTSSNGCAALADVETTAGRPDLQVLDFDASADEHAQFQVAFPKSWNEGTITYRVFWTSSAIDTDGVTWGLQGVACADGDTADVVYGTPATVDDANQSTAEDVYVSPTSGAVTIAGTPSNDELTFFRIFRDVSDANDTAAEDARLIGLQIFITINAGDDS